MTNRSVGWATGASVTLVGTAVILVLGRYSRTPLARDSALGAVGLVAVVAGFSAWHKFREAADSGTWRAVAASMLAGTAVGVIALLVLGCIAVVAGMIYIEHSGFVGVAP